ncbi:MAG: hypothetical protein COV60_02540 [Candidatus Magasanikbacteria bacterium CG11_big_fil_rev_8_21_14_0_20_43_7]|uniref:PIN domain-containing protein n=1 Tax=Candidatus Magasanikbacteria bacterium CG11_big_fil_rev_8_21_14_0_20_43_7 TaxID=1974654 RepID=A0A2H0N286_9BACT|nr:MAG: hypothetical protein COV60_02540 [Candidatus Magasanikbacteria bacterium CG11_big_fil_rev_8_21_14_0_20_43_7]
MIFIDTNYFARFFIGDVLTQQQHVSRLFVRAEKNHVQLMSSITVLFELYWVLYKFYQLEKEVVINTIEKVLEEYTFVKIQERETGLHAVAIASDYSIDFPDAYHLAYALKHGATECDTFDKKMQKIFQKEQLVNA